MKQVPMMKFELKAKDPKRAELLIYDDIGASWLSDGVTAWQVAADLKALGDIDVIDVRINSAGGSVMEAQGIYAQLTSHPADVHVFIDGMALSAASYIAMAGNKITVAEDSLMMIHRPRGIVIGNVEDMRSTADTMDKIGVSIAKVYAARSKKDVKEIEKMMADETFMDAQEAIDHGFADDMAPALRIAAAFDVTQLYRVPDRFVARLQCHKQKEPKMATDTVKMTAAEFAKLDPDAVRDWNNEGFKEGHDTGVSEERERGKALAEAFRDRPDFAMGQYLAGNDIARAKAALADVLLEENKAKDKALAEAHAKLASASAVSELTLDGSAKIGGTADKYANMSFEQRTRSEWNDNADGCKEKFKVPQAYALFRRSEEEARSRTAKLEK